jgi:hypothetical protein
MTIHRIAYLNILLLLAIGLSGLCGCADGNKLPSDADSLAEPLQLTFTLKVDARNAASRADEQSAGNSDTWGSDSYTKEERAYDADINTESVKVALFSINDGGSLSWVATVEKLNCFQTTEGVYQYYGTVPAEKITAGQTYRCMVVANIDKSKVDFENLTTNEPTFLLSDLPEATADSHNLPMWGMASFTANQGGNQLSSITLLRATAKCRVSLTEELVKQGYTLKSVTLRTLYKEGYLLPKNYNNVESTGDLSYTYGKDNFCFHPIALEENEKASTNAQNVPLHQEPGTAAAAQSYIAYFPEAGYEDGTNSERPYIAVDVTYTDNNGNATTQTTYNIEFKDYSNGTPYTRLVRNHVYDFQIQGFAHGLQLKVKASDWEEETMDWDFTDHISIEQTLKWTENTYSSQSADTDKEKYVTVKTGSSAPALEGTFQIESPIGAQWVASLSPSDYFNFVDVDEDEDGNKVINYLGSSVTGEVVDKTEGSNLFTIKIMPLYMSNTSQHETKLTFYIRYPDGNSSTVNDLNGWTIIQPI